MSNTPSAYGPGMMARALFIAMLFRLASPRGRYYYYLSDVDIGLGEEWPTGSPFFCHWISRFWSKTAWLSKLPLAPGLSNYFVPCIFHFFPQIIPHTSTIDSSKSSWPMGKWPKPLHLVLPTKSRPYEPPRKSREEEQRMIFPASASCRLWAVSCQASYSTWPFLSLGLENHSPFTLPDPEMLLGFVLSSNLPVPWKMVVFSFSFTDPNWSVLSVSYQNLDWCVPRYTILNTALSLSRTYHC